MKKLISLALALTMVLSICPTILSTNASAWTSGMWSGPDTSTAGVSAVVSFSTDVLRVASQRYSPISGNKVVAATPSGSPEVANNTAAAYAGETPVIPKVYLELGEEADSTPTITFTSANGNSGTSISTTYEGMANNIYEWTIAYDGATSTATAGDTLIVTITYSVNGTSYTSYGALAVQRVQGGIGQDIYRGKSKNSTGGSTVNRFEATVRVLGKGLYVERNTSTTYGAFGATDSAHSTFNFNASETDYDSEGANLQYYHVTNDTVTQNCYKSGQYTQAKTVYNMGYVDDSNRPIATLYVDRSQYTTLGSSGANLRYEVVNTGYDSGDAYGNYVCVNRSRLDSISWAIGGNDTEGDSATNTSPYVTQPPFATDSTQYAVSGTAVGAYGFWNFGGQLSTLSNSTGSAAYSFSWHPQLRGWGSDESKCRTSMGFYIYLVDKGALRSLVRAVETGQGLSAAGLTADLGPNPQSGAYESSYYSTYLTAYQNALKELGNPRSTNQNTINTRVNDLKSAYDALASHRLTGKVYAHCVLSGTQVTVYNNWSNDLYVANGGTTAALTSPAKDIGSDITFTAPTINGYTLQSTTTQTVSCIDQTMIICYYSLAKETYTFDPVVVDAGEPKTKDFEYLSTFVPLQDAPTFTYNHYHVEGWYKNYNATTGAYSNKLNSVTVDTNPFTLYAKWASNPLVIHYDLGDTPASMADSYFSLGSTITQPADPVVAGFAFLGWYSDASYITPFTWGEQVWYSDVGDSTPSPYDSESLTAYALFESYNNKIVFRTNGGNAVEPLDVAGLQAGASITLPTPTRAGYTFDGWYVNDSLTGTYYNAGANTLPASHVGGGILYAKWTPNPITLTYNIGYNPNLNNSPVDSIHNPDNITGLTGSPIRDAYTAQGMPLPADPVKFGYVFGGWYIGSTIKTYNDQTTYNAAVSGGAITLVDPATDNFPASAASSMALSAVWVRTTTAAFIELDAYKEMYGELVPVADTDINPGDIITVQMKSTTNFYTASSLFVYMYDNTMFELIGSGTNAFTINSDNGYISAISGTNGTDYTGYTASPARSECPSGYNWIQIAIDPDVLGGVTTGGQMNDGTWMVQFKLRVKNDESLRGTSGIIYMDNAWTRDPDNNNGTMFYGWLDSASTTVWNSHNNFVTPLLQLATDTVTVATQPAPQSKITADPNGGTWSDNSTGTKSYTGDVGEEIEGYAEPTRRGYELTGWYVDPDDTTSDEWISGYYGSQAQNNKTFKAKWTAVEYKVTWNPNGGAYEAGTTGLDQNGNLVDEFGYEVQYSGPSTLPVMQGYEVTGWSLTPDGAAVTFPQTMVDNDNTVYYAIWGPAHDTPFKVTVVYLNNQTGNYQTSETSGGAFVGTTGATVHFVPNASTYTNTDSDVYFSYSQLPTIQNGRYSFDASSSLNNLTCTIAADGSGNVVALYRGTLYSGTFNANGGSYSGYSVADDRDAYGAGYVYEDSSTYVLYREFQTSFADENDTTVPVIPPVTPVKPGYTFIGWNTNANASTAANIGMATSNRTYYAVWQGNPVDNTFSANGGMFDNDPSVTSKTVTSTVGQTVTEPNSPSRPSYQFLGWSTNPNATTADTLGTQGATGTTYYAVWQLTSQPYYEYIYIMGTDGTYPASPTYTEEKSGSGTVTLDYSNYVISGASYYDAQNANNVPSATLNESTVGTTVILKAYIGRATHTVTVNYTMSDGSTAPAASTETVYYDAAYSITPPAVTGYTAAPAAVTGTMGTADVTESVTYTPNEYTASFYVDGTVATTKDVAYNATITTDGLPTPVKEGNTFLGWSRTEGATAPDASLGTMDSTSGVNFYAVFEANEYTITYRFRPASGTSINFTTANVSFTDGQANQTSLTTAAAMITRVDTYTYGATVVAPVIVIPGYEVTATSPAIPETMPAGNRTVQITISVISYQLTVNYVMSDGSTAPAAHTENVPYNTAYSVASPAVTGYTPDVATVTGTMDDVNGKTVTVTYTPNPHTVTWNLDGGKIGNDAGPIVQNTVFGATVTAPGTPVKDGYTFAAWTPAPASTVPDENLSYTATYTTNKYDLVINYVMSDGSTAPAAYESLVSAGNGVAYGGSYSVTSPTVAGYTPDVATVSGTMDSTSGKTITVTYSPNSYTLSITYVMSDGTTAPAAVSQQVPFNTTYSVGSPTVDGYTPDVATVTGTMDDVNGKSVTVTYSPNGYTLTVNYVMSDNTTAPEAHTETVAYGVSYSVGSPTVAGYTPDVATVTGTMDVVGGKTVTVTYSPNSYTLTVNYEVSDGKVAVPATHTESVVFNTAYSVGSPAVAGYTPDVATVTGTMDDVNGKTVTVTYTPNTYELTVNYVMADGTTAPAAHTENVVFNTDYTVGSPEVAGYTPDRATVTGTMDTVGGKTETVTYSLNSYTVTFLRPTAANADSLLDNAAEKTVADWAQVAAYATESTGSQAYNSAITVPATLPEIANYTFGNEWVWFNADTGAQIEAQATVPAFNVTAIAIYTRVPVTIEENPGQSTVIDKVDNPTSEFTGYIYGLDEGITTAQLAGDYAQVTGNGSLVITPVEAYAFKDACGTGTKVELVDNVTHEVLETYYVVVYGDLNGDGKVNNSDVQLARMEVAATPNAAVGKLWSVDENDAPLNPETTPAPILLAADFNGDGRITSADTTAIRNIAMGKTTVNQVTGEVTTI